jgi:hypothetical protein
MSKNSAVIDTSTSLCLIRDSICRSIYEKIDGAIFDTGLASWIYPIDSQVPEVEVPIGENLFKINTENLALVDDGAWVYGAVSFTP